MRLPGRRRSTRQGLRQPPLQPALGLTLVEATMTLALLTLLLALAAPSFHLLLDRWRIREAEAALTSTLHFARAEALRRGGNVVIQKNVPHSPGCTAATGAADWGCGWFVFADRNGNGRLDTEEEILHRVHLPHGVQVQHDRRAPFIRLDRWGQMDGLGAKRFVAFPLAGGQTASATRSICISAGGRVRSQAGAAC